MVWRRNSVAPVLRWAVSYPAALVTVAGCTQFEPGTDVIAQAQQPATGGADFRCLGDGVSQSSTAPQSNEGSVRAVRSLRIVGFVGEGASAEARVRACSVRDPECLTPLTPWLATGTDGWVDVPVFTGFDGYLEITAPGAVPVMLFYSAALQAGEPADEEPEFLVDERNALSFDQLFLGRAAFPESGVMTLRARDCAQAPAAGVQFSLEPGAVGWYYVDEIPVGTATETTESGVGGFSDLQPGTAVVSASVVATGALLAPPTSVFVRSGWFTNVRFTP